MTLKMPEYREASFRGVSFLVTDQSIPVGRAGVLHEYLDDDTPYFDDTGTNARVISVSAHFIGEDHLEKALAFEKVLNIKGGGVLVLPSRHVENVVCTEGTRTDTLRTEKNITRFSLTFTPVNEFKFPASVLEKIHKIFATVTKAVSAVQSIVAIPDALASYVQGEVLGALSVFGVSSRVEPNAPSISSFMARLTESASPKSAVGVYMELTKVKTESASPSADEASYFAEFRTAAALYGALAAIDLDFESQGEAVSVRDTLYNALTADLDLIPVGAVDVVLMASTEFLEAFTEALALVAPFKVSSFRESLPSVVASQRIYGDGAHHEELARWNGALHPLFMPFEVEFL